MKKPKWIQVNLVNPQSDYVFYTSIRFDNFFFLNHFAFNHTITKYVRLFFVSIKKKTSVWKKKQPLFKKKKIDSKKSYFISNNTFFYKKKIKDWKYIK
jgi:hypothetical protein